MPSFVLVNPSSPETIEKAKWEMFPNPEVIGPLTPGNPYRKGNTFGKPGCEYPKMLYRARRLPGNGKWATGMDEPKSSDFWDDPKGVAWNGAMEAALAFNASCRRIVNSPEEEAREKNSNEGWRESIQEAMAFQQDRVRAEGNEAAERNYRDRNMSEAAKAEAAAFEESNFGHQPVIPEAPLAKRRGRPRKVQPVSA